MSDDKTKYYSSPKNESGRKVRSQLFAIVCLIISSLAVVILITLLATIIVKGKKTLINDTAAVAESTDSASDDPDAQAKGPINWNFLSGVHKENNPEESGIGQAIIGSALICFLCALVAIPVGVGTAIFLEEFQPRNKILRWIHGLVQLNISNLAGVPSIVYGILGLTAFVYLFNVLPSIKVEPTPIPWEVGADHWYQTRTLGRSIVRFRAGDRTETPILLEKNEICIDGDGNEFELKIVDKRGDAPADKELRKGYALKGRRASMIKENYPWYFRLPFGKSLLSAALTLALVILPIVIISSQEAIRGVPRSIREAAFGMGATRWQVVRKTVLPAATPGIMTGAILSMSRAIGEAAPVIAVMGSVLGTTRGVESLMSQTPVLPVTIYRWAGDENPGFENASSAAIIVLLIVLLIMNSVAILIRNRFEKKLS